MQYVPSVITEYIAVTLGQDDYTWHGLWSSLCA